MDAKFTEVASQPLKYQTWFLKVSIHCEGCRRKVKKILQSIDGVFTTTIDSQQHKVTVTGSVGVETLLRKLVKAGKHAEIWPENLGKSSGKEKKKKNGARDTETLENHSDNNLGTESAVNCNNKSKSSNSKAENNSPEKSPAGIKGAQSEGGGGGSGKNKNKKKGQSGGNGSNGLSSVSIGAPAHTGLQFQNHVGQQMGQINLCPTRQYPSYQETGYPPMVSVAATYNMLYPMGRMGTSPSYYVPYSPYMCTGLDHDTCQAQFQSTPLVSFEIFSDENANGCSIM